MIGDGLRMIAGRCRDHSARALLGRQLQQFVERAAFLVGGGELQILELQPHLGADDFGKVRLTSIGVRMTAPLMRSAAARMSSIVGGCMERLKHAGGLAVHLARGQC